MNEYHELLHQYNLRDTLPRRHVFTALLHAETPLSIADIARVCAGVNRTTIYRSLDTLRSVGVVQVVPVGWKQRYELTSLFRDHHHHLHCSVCGKVIDVASPKLEQLIQEVAEQYHFMPRSHTFEVTGICQACRKGQGTIA